MYTYKSAVALLALTLAGSGLAQDAGADALARAGLDPMQHTAGAINVVSVRAPWTEAARVAFAGVDIYNTDGNLARLGPGRDELLPVPRAQVLWAADPALGYAIDCLVTGDAQTFVTSWFDGERLRENRRDTTVARVEDRLSFHMAPGTAGNVYLHSVDAGWAFKECSIVAVGTR